MRKDWRLYIEDMAKSSASMISYAEGLLVDDLFSDRKTYDAIVKNVIVLGEAARMIPDEIRNNYTAINWRSIVATRNLFVHQYDEIDEYELMEIIRNDLPELLENLRHILEENRD